MSESRYELGLTIGPCSETERDALMGAIIDLPEAKAVGAGAVSCYPLETYYPVEEDA